MPTMRARKSNSQPGAAYAVDTHLEDGWWSVCIVAHGRSQWRIVADPPMLAIAHRFGNQVADVRLALDAGVDLVEADVHYYRRELEVRHLKTLGPHLLWDKGQVVRREGLTL